MLVFADVANAVSNMPVKYNNEKDVFYIAPSSLPSCHVYVSSTPHTSDWNNIYIHTYTHTHIYNIYIYIYIYIKFKSNRYSNNSFEENPLLRESVVL